MFCHNDHAPVFKQAFKAYGLTNIETVYWHKTGFNTEGNSWQYLQAMETFVLGHRRPAGEGGIGYNMPANPLDRHNVVEMKAVSTDRKRYPGSGEVVNITEKPRGMGTFFCDRFVPPEATVIVGCAGSGGEVRGCLEANRNVVAVDMCKDQTEFMREYFGTLDAVLALETEHAEAKAARTAGGKKSPDLLKDDDPTREELDGTCPTCGCEISAAADILTCACTMIFCRNCGWPEWQAGSDVLPEMCTEECKGAPVYEKPALEPEDSTQEVLVSCFFIPILTLCPCRSRSCSVLSGRPSA
jgi:hypothetical protein